MATERQILNARRLRSGSTEAEARLWSMLRARQIEGAKFVRQHPIDTFIVDFCCRSARLVLEVDGGQHADDPCDAARTEAIEAAGYLVLRFWNNDVLSNTEGVVEDIRRSLLNARG